jgi:hypothetical protein
MQNAGSRRLTGTLFTNPVSGEESSLIVIPSIVILCLVASLSLVAGAATTRTLTRKIAYSLAGFEFAMAIALTVLVISY